MKNWQIYQDNQYYPNNLESVADIPGGTYRLCDHPNFGLGFEEFMTEVHTFLNSREKYEKYGFSYKRGCILFGKPGNGKSILIQLISNEILKLGGMTLLINNAGSINACVSLLSNIRAKDPKRLMLIVFEELDLLLEHADRVDRSTFLNLLDGGTSIDNVLYLATTNEPEKLKENVYNRPSRFDLRIEVKNPTQEVIKAYLEQALQEDDKLVYNMDDLAHDLEGVSLAGIKEFIIAHFVIGNPYKETIEKLRSFKAAPKNSEGKSVAGFGRNQEERELKARSSGNVPIALPSAPIRNTIRTGVDNTDGTTIKAFKVGDRWYPLAKYLAEPHRHWFIPEESIQP